MKKFVPHLIALGIFIAISAIYFSPVFEGKILSAHDIDTWKGMSKEVQDHRSCCRCIVCHNRQQLLSLSHIQQLGQDINGEAAWDQSGYSRENQNKCRLSRKIHSVFYISL